MTMHYLPPLQQRPQPQPQSQPRAMTGADKYLGDVAEGYDSERQDTEKWKVEQKIIEGMIAELPAASTVLDCPLGTGRFLDCYVANKVSFIGADKSGDKCYVSARKLIGNEAKRWVDDCDAWIGRFVQIDPNAGTPMLDHKGRPVLTGESVGLTIDGDAAPKVGTRLGLNGRPAVLGVDTEKLRSLKIKDKGVIAPGNILKIGLSDKSVDCALMIRLSRWLSPDDNQAAMRELMRVTRGRIIWTARVANHVHARTVELFEAALHPGGWKVSRNEAGYILDYRILEARPA